MHSTASSSIPLYNFNTQTYNTIRLSLNDQMLQRLTWPNPLVANWHIAWVPPFIESYMSLLSDFIRLGNRLPFLFYRHMTVCTNNLNYKDVFICATSIDSILPRTHYLSELFLSRRCTSFDMVNSITSFLVSSFPYVSVLLPLWPLFYCSFLFLYVFP